VTPDDSQLEIGVGERRLRLPLEVVEAVALAPPVTSVPGTPARLAGLINHQGTVYPAVRPTDRPGEAHHVVLVRTARHGRLALLCDWAHGLVTAAPDVELLDVDALAAEVVAASATVDQWLPRPARPRAIARLRGRTSR
jgi:hypothetical protein